MQVAVLGLGRMGRELAGRLLEAGHQLSVWNRSPGRAGELVERGATEAESVAAATAGAEFVVVSLSGDDAVRDVLLPEGEPRNLAATIVDCSTVSPALSRAEAEAYPERFVACPIAGAPQAVQSGQALLIVGGAAVAVSRAEPILAALGGHRRDAGSDAGTAATIKLLNNYLLLGSLALLADVVALGQAAGFADADLAELLAGLPTVAPGLVNRIDGLLGTEHEPWFSVDLGRKDLRLLGEVAAQAGTRLGLADQIRRRYDEAGELNLGDRDLSAVIETLRRSN